MNNLYVKINNTKKLYGISKQLAYNILKYLHEEYKHIGVRKTWLILRKKYIATNDMAIMKNIIKTCKICQIYKNINNINYNIIKNIISKDKVKIVAMDSFGELTTTSNGKRCCSNNRFVHIIYKIVCL